MPVRRTACWRIRQVAELTPSERLLPSLLDRLTDENPGSDVEAREHRSESVFKLRQAVLRDLQWLMNTGNLESLVDLKNYPEVAESVLNFGMPNLSGQTISTVDIAAIERDIKRVIQLFEPRILKGTLRIKAMRDGETAHRNAVAFQIEGTLWGKPMPEALFLRTEVDLELGEVKVTEGVGT